MLIRLGIFIDSSNELMVLLDLMKKPMPNTDSFVRNTLPGQTWRKRIKIHKQNISSLIGGYLDKRSRHIKDPVMDFLFEYYAFRPSHLKRWSPGFGTVLCGVGKENGQVPELSNLTVEGSKAWLDPALFPDNRRSSVRWILRLLKNTKNSPPAFGCFGMHEWAMVYRADTIRHDYLSLRMPEEKLAEFVESRPLICTHYDAFRFFTGDAKPLNKHGLSHEDMPYNEQPGCLHTNMDLYKWAFKMYPWISSDTIRNAFKLAVEARYIDMKASPYDLREYGLEPIKIETEQGRLVYLEHQKEIFHKSQPVRERLIEEYRFLAKCFGIEE